MRPLFTAESMTGVAALRFATASSLLPASTAFTTPLMAVRSLDRAATLRARRLTVWRARFSADLILATDEGLQKRGAILPMEGRQRKPEVGDCAFQRSIL